ncbi:MAG TPA: DUF4386 domain-containing protein [Pyrinomonadaceae bacterium]|jgi:hypothetical protein|nr:DUF4386 domain-containing protein [Pyrinomonadaceae bacterium]
MDNPRGTNVTTATPRLKARIAGAFYLITIIMGVFAEVFVRGAIVVRDNAAATATNILAHEPLYRFGLAADLIMIACYIAVTLLFYGLFKPVGRSLSLLAAFFSLIGIAVLAANSLNHLAPLVFLRDAQYLSAFETTQLQALALMSLKMHARGYSIAGLFFGVYCVMIGYFVFRSGFLPRILGVLMAIGGLSFLIDSFASFLLPTLVARLPDIGMLGGIAELALCLWLMVMGVNSPKWEEKASAQQISGA